MRHAGLVLKRVNVSVSPDVSGTYLDNDSPWEAKLADWSKFGGAVGRAVGRGGPVPRSVPCLWDGLVPNPVLQKGKSLPGRGLAQKALRLIGPVEQCGEYTDDWSVLQDELEHFVHCVHSQS